MSGSLKGVPIDLVKDISAIIGDNITASNSEFKDYDIKYLVNSSKSKKKFTNYL